MTAPLQGLRVLDLSRVLAGPWCAQNLGDLGAEVIKVERPGRGDDARQFGPPWMPDAAGEPTGESAYFLCANRNKRSVAIDLAAPAGQALVRELARASDVLVENYKVGTLARYGLGYADLVRINPRLIYCSISAYGQDGPYAKRPGYDYLFQGACGLMSVTGEPDDLPGGGPQRIGVPIVDMFTGMYAGLAVLAALAHRHSTGAGQYVDVSLFASAMALGATPLSDYIVGASLRRRSGNSATNIAPYSVFRCCDGDLIIATANDGQFVALCRALQRPDWAQDERFHSNQARLANLPALHALLGEVLAAGSRQHWEDLLVPVGVPCGPINDYRQAIEHPQALHLGTKVKTPHRLGVPAASIASPMRFSETPAGYRRAPPLLGEHTREVLREELGLSEEEVARLHRQGVIGFADEPTRVAAAIGGAGE